MTKPEQHIGIFTTDTALVVRSWDAWLARVTTISVEAAHRRPLAQLVPDLEARGLRGRFQRVLLEGVVEVLAPAFHDHLIPCAPQTPSRHFVTMQQWVTIAPLLEGDRIVGTLVTIEDVTARLEREHDLAEQLGSPDETIRLQAARALEAENGPADLLIGALDDDSWRVRQTATNGLMRHGGPAAIVALLQALREEYHNPNVLNSALQVLALTDIDVVEPLIACLYTPEADLRIYAALALGERHDPRAIAALIRALDDADLNVRYQAIESLGMLRAPEAVDTLLTLAESRDFFLAFPAIDALTRIGDPRAGPRLVPLLEEDILRAPVAEALGQFGDEAAVGPLVALLNTAGAPTVPIVQALAALHDRYEQVYSEGRHIADLVCRSVNAVGAHNVLEALDYTQGSQLRALVLVLGWLEGAAVQRTLARLLGQPTVRKAVMEALVRHGARVTELLITQLGAEDLETRQAAVIALGRIGDARAVPALIGVLEGDPELAPAAADALGAIGDRRAFTALLSLLGHPVAMVRQAVVGALNSLGHPDLEARIRALLATPDPHERESAIKIAGYFGYASCVDAVLACCADADERVRRAAIEHLPYLEDPRVPLVLAGALQREVPSVRAAAARAFAQVERALALPHLLAALDDADPWVRYFAARSIGQHAYPEAIEAIARLTQTDPASHVRIASLETLGRIGGARAVESIQPFCAADDPDIARAALQALGRLPHPAALAPLLAVLRTPDHTRRIEALRALAQRGEEAIEALRKVAASDSKAQVVQVAIEMLAQVGSERAIAALIGLAAHAARRAACIAALAHLSDDRIMWVARGLMHSDAEIRGAIVEALAQMKQPRASEHLLAALSDQAAAVRLAAARALAQLGNRQAEQRLVLLARMDPDPTVRRAAHAALRR